MTEENLHLKGDSTNLVKALETATTAFNTYGDTVVKVSASQQAALGKSNTLIANLLKSAKTTQRHLETIKKSTGAVKKAANTTKDYTKRIRDLNEMQNNHQRNMSRNIATSLRRQDSIIKLLTAINESIKGLNTLTQVVAKNTSITNNNTTQMARNLTIRNEHNRTVRTQTQHVNRANNSVRTYNRLVVNAAKQTDHLTLSWKSMMRILSVQIIHRAIMVLTQGLTEAVKVAMELELRIGEVQTIAQDQPLGFDTWVSELRALSDAWGLDIVDQAEAAYQTLSNQVAKGARSIEFLGHANRFAVTTLSKVEDAVNLGTAAINSFRLSTNDANRIYSTFFKTIELGRVRTADMANHFGRVGVPAAQLGATLEETSAAISTATIRGIRFQEASTFLRNVLLKLLRPTKAMKELFRSVGVETGEALVKTYGFSGALAIVEQHAQGSSAELGKLFGRIRAVTGAMIYAGDGLKTYDEALKKITESQETYNKATQKTLETSGKQFQVAINKIKNEFISGFGQTVLAIGVALNDLKLLEVGVKALATTITMVLVPALGIVAAKLVMLSLSNPFTAAISAAIAMSAIYLQLAKDARVLREEHAKFITASASRGAVSGLKHVEQKFKRLEKGLVEAAKQAALAVAVVKSELHVLAKAGVADFDYAIEQSRKQMKVTIKSAKDNISTIKDAIKETKKAIDSLGNSIRRVDNDIKKVTRQKDKTLFEWSLDDKTLQKQFNLIEGRIAELRNSAESVQFKIEAEQGKERPRVDLVNEWINAYNVMAADAAELAAKQRKMHNDAQKDIISLSKKVQKYHEQRNKYVEDHKRKLADLNKQQLDHQKARADALGDANKARKQIHIATTADQRDAFKKVLEAERREEKAWKSNKNNYAEIKRLQKESQDARSKLPSHVLKQLREYEESRVRAQKKAKESQGEQSKVQQQINRLHEDHNRKVTILNKKLDDTKANMESIGKLVGDIAKMQGVWKKIVDDRIDANKGFMENMKDLQAELHVERVNQLEKEIQMRKDLFELERAYATLHKFNLEEVLKMQDPKAVQRALAEMSAASASIVSIRKKMGLGVEDAGKDRTKEQIKDYLRLQKLQGELDKAPKNIDLKDIGKSFENQEDFDKFVKTLNEVAALKVKLSKAGVTTIDDTEINRVLRATIAAEETLRAHGRQLRIDELQARHQAEIKNIKAQASVLKKEMKKAREELNAPLAHVAKTLGWGIGELSGFFSKEANLALNGLVAEYGANPNVKSLDKIIKVIEKEYGWQGRRTDTDDYQRSGQDDARRKVYRNVIGAFEQLATAFKATEKERAKVEAMHLEYSKLAARIVELQPKYKTAAEIAAESIKDFATGVDTVSNSLDNLKDIFEQITDEVRDQKRLLEDMATTPRVQRPPVPNRAMGGYITAAQGMPIQHGVDTVPAMLTPGEFVMNPRASSQFYSTLTAMNSGVSSFKDGGDVHVGDINLSVTSAGPNYDARALGTALKREIRRGRFSW
jgi:TP901 family phage tail tape measure protein